MPSTVGRRLMQKNMSKAAKADKKKDREGGVGDDDIFEDNSNPAPAADEGNYTYPDHLDDVKEDQPVGRSIFGRGGKTGRIRKSSSFGDSGFTKSDTTLTSLDQISRTKSLADQGNGCYFT